MDQLNDALDRLLNRRSGVRRVLRHRPRMPRRRSEFAIFAAVALGGWLFTGLYHVTPRQVGVEMVLGAHTDTTGQGLHWNWPAPVGQLLLPNVTHRNVAEIGYRSDPLGDRRAILSESEMLTGDENIVSVQAAVFWRIDPRPAGVARYLFNIRGPDHAVKEAAEAALRAVVGREDFAVIRTTGRDRLEREAQAITQSLLRNYGAGVVVLDLKFQDIEPPASVLDAFKDVQAASADGETMINRATAYLNRTVELAQGTAAQLVRRAEAYKAERVALALGRSEHFEALLEPYQQAPEITRTLIYMRTIGDILEDADKVLLSGNSASRIVPYLQIRERRSGVRHAPSAATTRSSGGTNDG